MSLRIETIGDCTLYLADCRDVMPTLTADHIITDPPYEAFMHDKKNSMRGGLRRDSGTAPRSLDFAPIDDIRHDFVRLSSDICKGWFIAFCTIEGVCKWADEINLSSMKYKRACVWVKPDSAPQFNGQCPAVGIECFVTAWNGIGHSFWNGGGKRNVYTHNVNSRHRHGGHPTEKPVSLMTEIVCDFTSPGDVILDPFIGSGTTGISCINMSRKFIGIERDQKYFDISCRRIEDAIKQCRLFAEPIPKYKQLNLIN